MQIEVHSFVIRYCSLNTLSMPRRKVCDISEISKTIFSTPKITNIFELEVDSFAINSDCLDPSQNNVFPFQEEKFVIFQTFINRRILSNQLYLLNEDGLFNT